MEQNGATAQSPAGDAHHSKAPRDGLLTAWAKIAGVALMGVAATGALGAAAVVKLAPAGLPW